MIGNGRIHYGETNKKNDHAETSVVTGMRSTYARSVQTTTAEDSPPPCGTDNNKSRPWLRHGYSLQKRHLPSLSASARPTLLHKVQRIQMSQVSRHFADERCSKAVLRFLAVPGDDGRRQDRAEGEAGGRGQRHISSGQCIGT